MKSSSLGAILDSELTHPERKIAAVAAMTNNVPFLKFMLFPLFILLLGGVICIEL
jgi:hypothetical protein